MKVDMLKQQARVYLTNKDQLMDKKLKVVTSYQASHAAPAHAEYQKNICITRQKPA